ncbi:MAG: BrnT family toxin [Acidobacteria bacterium]|nr:BrnT family toxin [Acidobacteriota bacterium]MBI3421668.1 BrnT family toxin [Acidobacteriota bacterium]
MGYRFKWDPNKAAANLVNHQGVSFDEASTVFDHPPARIFDDEVHSFDERREIIIGPSINERLLLLCFIEQPNEIIRIISARLPTPRERKAYEENTGF